jgi:DNA-binding beta-propeller fold protein YncE
MKKNLFYSMLVLLAAVFVQCKKDNNNNNNNNNTNAAVYTNGVWVLNQGAFLSGNSSIDFLSRSGSLASDVFKSANSRPLGDVLQSMISYNGNYFLVVNNSQKIEVTDANMKSVGTISGMTSPRYMLPINSTKAYVTDFSNSGISIINPSTRAITGKISYSAWTEQLVLSGTNAFITAPGSQKLLIVDTKTDAITDSIAMKGEPQWIVQDAFQKLWVLTNGSYDSDSSSELYEVDPAAKSIVKDIHLSTGWNAPSFLAIDKEGMNLYFIYNNNLYKIATTDTQMSSQPFTNLPAGSWYGLGIDPSNDDIYLADAADYKSKGSVLKISNGTKTKYAAGVVPGGFYFVQ